MNLPLLLFLACLAVSQAAKPCKKKLPTTTPQATTQETTNATEVTEVANSTDLTDLTESTNATETTVTLETTTTPSTTTVIPTTTIDIKAPCMAEWTNMKPDDGEYMDSSSGSQTAASSEECGEICMKDATCGYVFYDTSKKCVTFPKFTVLDFDKNAEGSMIFKLYLNGTGTCSSISLPDLATAKTKMYYPEGGSYWLFNNIMDLISYACYNPELGYKRRKRSAFNWMFNFGF